MLQEDNCCSHRARIITTYLLNEEVTHMKWTAQSADLNPIENVWGLFKTHLRKRRTHPSSTLHLFNNLTGIWNNLPNSHFKSLVASMPKSVELVRKNRGILLSTDRVEILNFE